MQIVNTFETKIKLVKANINYYIKSQYYNLD